MGHFEYAKNARPRGKTMGGGGGVRGQESREIPTNPYPVYLQILYIGRADAEEEAQHSTGNFSIGDLAEGIQGIPR